MEVRGKKSDPLKLKRLIRHMICIALMAYYRKDLNA